MMATKTAKATKTAGGCPSSDNPSLSKFHAWGTVCDFDKGTWRETCRYCGADSGRKGAI